ncbi:MAG: S8/S53 family peptidase [Bacteriovoracia bacterium]
MDQRSCRNGIGTTLGWVGVLAVVGWTTACGKPTTKTSSPELEQAVRKLQEGDVVRRIEQAKTAAPTAPTPPPALLTPPAAVAEIPEAVPEICADVKSPDLSADGSEAAVLEKMKATLVASAKFTRCFREALKPAEVYGTALSFMRVFETTAAKGELPISQLTVASLKTLLEKRVKEYDALTPADLFISSAKQSVASPIGEGIRVRGGFSDADFSDWIALAHRRRDALVLAEKQIFAAMEKHSDFFARMAAGDIRFKILQVLRETAGDVEGRQTAQGLTALLQGSGAATPDLGDQSTYPFSLLHPYAIESAVPTEHGALPMFATVANPFGGPMRERMGATAVGDALTDANVAVYRAFVKLDNPKLPDPGAPAAHPVRVAYIDSGIDFVSQPELGLFMNKQDQGGLRSYDYTDDDANPWMPLVGSLGHGTGTSATLLTLMAKLDPQALLDDRLDLAMWKVASLQTLMGGAPYTNFGAWTARIAPVVDAIIHQMNLVETHQAAAPDVVSISMAFRAHHVAKALGREDWVSRAPWLWVMAAGNSGAEVERDRASCLTDVPADQRPADRLLCVGALARADAADAQGETFITHYSNHGQYVDVYAYESYDKLCPNGTSCATPAITAAAALLKSRRPELTPAQIRETIVRAAVEQEVDVALSPAQSTAKQLEELKQKQPNSPPAFVAMSPATFLSPPPGEPKLKRLVSSGQKRTIKVFDTATMMERAYEMADLVLSANGRP